MSGFGERLRAVAARVIRHLGDKGELQLKRGAESWTLPRYQAAEAEGPADHGLIPRAHVFVVAADPDKLAPGRGDLLPDFGVTIRSVETRGPSGAPTHYRIVAGEGAP